MQGAHHKRNRGPAPRRACDPAIARCIGETGCIVMGQRAGRRTPAGTRMRRFDARQGAPR
ncbi:hypothetical protein WT00_10310 [Burkholderia territorii]|nr:hypothetical protein WT00_10310 [Burkholderia territorii]